MIVVDTSAIVAMAFGEPERAKYVRLIEECDRALLSSVSAVEAHMVVHGRRMPGALTILDGILGMPVFEVIAPGTTEVDIANKAFVRYGKGSGHPAQLNFGDLFSYALAKSRGLPLLFKGNDFSNTDIQSAASMSRDPE